jgi:hydrogenase-4 component F
MSSNPLVLLVVVPLAMLGASILLRRARVLAPLMAALGWLQLGVVLLICQPSLHGADSWRWHGFTLDRMACLFLMLTTLVAAASLTHGVFYFRRERKSEAPPQRNHVQQFHFFATLFLLAMYGAVTADNLGYLWISMEATTLLSAPLVYYHRTRSSLEATWKYLVICSVAITFAFMGTALLYAASQQAGLAPHGTLLASSLAAHASRLPPSMLRLAYVFMLLGYGTKAGLFPLHSWLPDAHSEAPAPASALLSGALLNCALVALWRICPIMAAAGDVHFVQITLAPMGAATVLAASVFLLKQVDYKRMWAYSSMENMGVMAVAMALGCTDGFGLAAVNHSLAKVALFLMAGNALQAFRTKKIAELHGLLTSQPLASLLLLAGAVAVSGTPPFGSFMAEWRILSVAADSGHYLAVAITVLGLAIAFIALGKQVSAMLFGDPMGVVARPARLRSMVASFGVPAMLLVGCLWLGLWLPPAWLPWLAGLGQ